MADFAPPAGPPPPRVPEGWKAVWNTEYKEWFYVNTLTKQSQWDKPTEPAMASSSDAAPGGPPPSYSTGASAPTTAGQDIKKPVSPMPGSDRGPGASNPYQQHLANDQKESDEAMARRLQQEEDARSQGPAGQTNTRGQAESYYGAGAGSSQYPSQPAGYNSNQTNLTPGSASYGGASPGYGGNSPQSQAQNRGSGGGLLGKLKDKFGGGAGAGYGPGQGYGQQQNYGPPQGQYYGGQPGYGPPQGYYPQQGYGGGGYQQQPQYYQQAQPQRKHGLGTGGAAALGVGGGLLGGLLLADGMEHMEQNSYDQGYNQGEMNDGGYGGGGDDGGFGGDGGDMGDGGGDF